MGASDGTIGQMSSTRWRKPGATRRSEFAAVPSEEILQRFLPFTALQDTPKLTQGVTCTVLGLIKPLEDAVDQIPETRLVAAAGLR